MENNVETDEKQIERIKAFLKKNNKTMDMFTRLQIKRFIEVDCAIQSRIEKRNRAVDMLKTSKINIKAIAEDLGIERQTVYNTPLLKEYIEYASAGHVNVDTLESIEQLRKDKNTLQNQIRGLVIRDTRESIILSENDKLLYRIKELEEQLIYLKDQHIHDLEEIKKLRQSSSKVITMPKRQP